MTPRRARGPSRRRDTPRALRLPNTTAPAYRARLNRVLTFIDQHLADDLSLDRLAQIACFSRFHFHRLFRAAVGETLNAYVSRLRLARAASWLKHHPRLTVTEAALRVGMPSPEHFSRAFKARYGVSPSRFRRDPRLRYSKMYQDSHPQSFYHVFEQSRVLPRRTFPVRVEQRPALHVAYVRGTFGADGQALVDAYLTLMRWAEPRGYMTPQARRIGVCHDDVELVPAARCRYDHCLTVPPHVTPDGPVGITTLAGGCTAVLPCQGDLVRVAQAWDYLYRTWLPASGYAPADRPALEVFVQGPETLGWTRFDLELCLPIGAL